MQTGFRGIDTAGQPKHYEEALVGAAVQWLAQHGVPRELLFLQTKFTPLAGQDPARLPYDMEAPIEQQVAQSFAGSLNNLQTDYLDCYILHSPLMPHTLLMRAWRAMEEIHASGAARLLGISNCYDADILKALHADALIKPAVVQNRFYRETGYDRSLRQWCLSQGVIYQSFWTLTANPHLLDSSTVRSLARHHGKTEAQVLFRYLNQSGILPLTGTTSQQHMQEDLAIFAFELTAAELESISRLLDTE